MRGKRVTIVTTLYALAARAIAPPARGCPIAKPGTEIVNQKDHGDRWQARGAETFEPGEVVEVSNIVDLTLVVRRAPVPAGDGGTL
jgi:hypothetical protein